MQSNRVRSKKRREGVRGRSRRVRLRPARAPEDVVEPLVPLPEGVARADVRHGAHPRAPGPRVVAGDAEGEVRDVEEVRPFRVFCAEHPVRGSEVRAAGQVVWALGDCRASQQPLRHAAHEAPSRTDRSANKPHMAAGGNAPCLPNPNDPRTHLSARSRSKKRLYPE